MANLQAEATKYPAEEASLLQFSFRVPGIFTLLAGGLVLRLILATYPGFGVDIGTFSAWSNDLAQNGPWNFYKADFFTDYAPGYMYVLLFIGKLNQQFDFTPDQMEYILKLPSIAADLGSAYLLYKLLDGRKMEMRLVAAAIYLFFPASLLIGAVWGQVDSLLAFFLLLTVYLIGRGRPVASAAAYTIGFLTKPQAIAALPFLAFWIMREHPPEWVPVGRIKLPKPPRVWGECLAMGLGLTLVLVIPFFEYEPWKLIKQLYDATNVTNYRVNSFFAYNFWNMFGIFDVGFKCDVALSDCASDAKNTEFLGIVTRIWSLALFAAGITAILVLFRKAQGTGMLALGTALSVLVFYLFLTRMHERYVFAVFLPLLAACALLQSRALWALFVALGTLHFLNLYHVYMSYYPNELKWTYLSDWFGESDYMGTGLETVQILSILMFVALPALMATVYVLEARRAPRTPSV